MFKRGGDVIDSQGSGITSGLDTPRSNYLGGGTIGGGTIHGNPIGNRTGFDEPSLLPKKQPEITPLEQLRYNARRKAADTGVTSEQYSSNALDAFASGFLNPKARTMGEALFYTNEARKSGIKPLEEKAAERKFEFEKIPLGTEADVIVTEAGLQESPTKTRNKIANKAMRTRNEWEAANPDKDFRESPLYRQWEIDMIQATLGKINTQAEAKNSALDILMQDETFAKMYRALPMMEEGETKDKYQKKVDAALKQLVDYLMSITPRTEGAAGGRIGYQQGIGPNVLEKQVTDTLQMPGETVQATEQVDEVLPSGAIGQPPTGDTMNQMPGQDPYLLLRARLPQEVPDDVVRLIAYNPEAFADFAAIESQEDVMLFNQKYGVELVLPTEQA